MGSAAGHDSSMSGLLTYALEFRGDVARDADGLVVRASAPSCTHETRLQNGGIVSRFSFDDCQDEAFLNARLQFDRDEGTFAAIATIDFGHGHELWVQTMDPGRLDSSADLHLRHGSATLHVVGGKGQFKDASGRITSNFVVSDTGELTDNQLGMLFLPPERVAAG
jgi:hypothetical protein